jgi:two-component system sensor histidine kinase GlrK
MPPAMHRYSFRQLLLVAFLLIAALLSAASLRGLFTLEQLLRQSSDGARRAVAHTADAQLLAERTVAMERSARQYLVLEDPVLRQRFEEAGRDARDALGRLADNLVSANLAAEWRTHESGIEAQLKGTPVDLREREASITTAFRELEVINDTIANEVRKTTEQRNQVLMDELEAGRAELGRQMLIAIAVAVVLAFVFGWWLARPLKRLEQAVVGLGENRLDRPSRSEGLPTCACSAAASNGCACASPSSIPTSRASCATCRTS